MILRGSATTPAPALLLLAAISAGGCSGDGGGRSPTAPAPEALGRAVETASAAAASAVYAVTTDTVLNLANLESLGTYDAASGWWQLTLPLQNGWMASLRLQCGDVRGAAQEHCSGPSTTWVRIMGSTTASVGYAGSSDRLAIGVTFDLTMSDSAASPSWVTYDGSGTCWAPDLAATFAVMHLSQPRSGTGYPSEGSMTVSVGETNAQLRFRGWQGVEGMYYDPYKLKYFSVNLTNGDIYRD